MKLNFDCPPISGNAAARRLVFSWDPETGEIDGPAADTIRERIQDGAVIAHPMPWGWELSEDPLRSWTDMAAIVGSEWQLPPELAEHYPKPPDDGDGDGNVYDERGRVIGRVTY